MSKRLRAPAYGDRKQRRRKRAYLRRPLSAGTLGKKLKQRFKYVTKIRLDAGISTPSGHVFSANGLYDPDITGTGHQPMGFDQLVGVFYQHYTVLSSVIKVTAISTGASSTPSSGSGIITVEPNGSVSLDTDIYDILERGKASNAVFNCADGGPAVTTLTKKCSIGSFLSQNVMQEDANAGTESANPTEQVYWHINTQAVDEITNPAIVNCLVEIWYDVVLHEPKDLTGS